MPPIQSHKRRFRISIRTVLLVFAAICAPLAVAINPVRQQEVISRRIQGLGGGCGYSASSPVPWWLGPVGWPGIVTVDLARTPATSDDFERVGALRGLTRLDVTATSATDDDLVHWAHLRQLRSLALSNTQISDAACDPIARLSKLNVLSLRGCSIGDKGLASLGGLSELQSLDLQSTAVTHRGLAQLAALPDLRSLYVDESCLTSESAASLATNPNLVVEVSVVGSSGKQLRELLHEANLSGRATIGPDGAELWSVGPASSWRDTSAGVAELVAEEAGLEQSAALTLLEVLASHVPRGGWVKRSYTPQRPTRSPPRLEELTSFEEFVAAVKSDNQRSYAIASYADQFTPSDLPRLIEALGEPQIYRTNLEACRVYARLLVRLGADDPTALEQLRQLLDDDDSHVRAVTFYEFNGFLRKYQIRNPEWTTRVIQSDELFDIVLSLADDPHWEVRSNVAGAIRSTFLDRGDVALPVLLKLVVDQSPSVRMDAVVALDEVVQHVPGIASTAAQQLRKLALQQPVEIRSSINEALLVVIRSDRQLSEEAARAAMLRFATERNAAALDAASADISNAAVWPTVVEIVVPELLKLSQAENDALNAAASQTLAGVASQVRARQSGDDGAGQGQD